MVRLRKKRLQHYVFIMDDSGAQLLCRGASLPHLHAFTVPAPLSMHGATTAQSLDDMCQLWPIATKNTLVNWMQIFL